ncbi:MAG: hypothetical protein Q8942_17780 [Bacillota bacterium]|nr:hypothetical protein [Bacillota bacterium]
MEYRVLVAHSCRDESVHSVDNVKIITKAYRELSFNEAEYYFKNEVPKAEYASTAVGMCKPLEDDQYKYLFEKKPTGETGFVFTEKYVKDDIGGKKIYALRGCDKSLSDISEWANTFGGKVILVACRGE